MALTGFHWRLLLSKEYIQVVQKWYSNSHFVGSTSVNGTLECSEYEPVARTFSAFLYPGYNLTEVVCSLVFSGS